MNSLLHAFKKPMVQASLIGAFGGISPKLIELVPRLFVNDFPSAGTLLGLMLLALIGGVIVRIYKEVDLKKALVLGAGAPAILATLTAQAVAPATNGFMFPTTTSIISVAYAQDNEGARSVQLIVAKNESPYSLNSLWIRSESKKTLQYRLTGDTLIVMVPASTRELHIDLPDQTLGMTAPLPDSSGSNSLRLVIVNNKQSKDFWQTFGNKRIPQFKIGLEE